MDRLALRLRQNAFIPLLLLLFSLLGTLSPNALANTGLLSGTVTSPAGIPSCDANGNCSIGIEVFAWDAAAGDYAPFPQTFTTAAADGTYSLELPLGQYRLVARDYGQIGLYFAPPVQDIQLSVAQNQAVADFIYARLGVVGRISLPAGFSTTDSYGNPLLRVELYERDMTIGGYNAYPSASIPVAADGSYSLETPEGNYKLVAVDLSGQLYFSPKEQEVQINVQNGLGVADFTAVPPLSISGQITLPASYSTTDGDGSNPWLWIELYAWDGMTGGYSEYPVTATPVAADGSYYLEAPEQGAYKLVPLDLTSQLHFSPKEQEVIVAITAGPVVANFIAAELGVSGQFSLPADYDTGYIAGSALLVVEAYSWDSLSGYYASYPTNVAPVAADGTYRMALPEGNYQLVPRDFSGVLHFAPAEQEIQVSVQNGLVIADFIAAELGVSGQITLPAGFNTTDGYGNPIVVVEAYSWDSLTGTYSDYPINGAPVTADGSYRLELPEGNYKLVPRDFSGVLHFAPAEQEIQVSVQNGLVIADFIAAQLGVSGHVTVPTGYSTTDSYGNPILMVEVFAWDNFAGRYTDYPVNGAPVAPDGSYQLELMSGNYKLVPRDFSGVLQFAPAEQQIQVSVQTGLVIADFVAAQLGVSGQVTLPAGYPTTDGYGNPTLWVEVYAWDSLIGTYSMYPTNGIPVAADGSYALELAEGKYKLAPVDITGQLAFVPAMQEVVVSVQGGAAVANFTAAQMGISGQITLPGGAISCDPYAGCSLGVEVYVWDSLTGRYSDSPITGGPVLLDGSFNFGLPVGQYKVIAVDYKNELTFTPAMHEVQLTADNGAAVINFTAMPLGISGTISGAPACDPYAGCSLGIEIYGWDDLTGGYTPYPIMVGPVLADGSYQFELPQGQYKVVAIDYAGLLFFSPAMQEVQLTATSGAATVDFTAAPMGITGHITPPAGYPLCDPYAGCSGGVEVYAWDELQGRFTTDPVMGGPIVADGSYRFELPMGRYQVVAVDHSGRLYFTPASQEVELTPDSGLAIADFAAHAPGISGQLSIDPRDAASVDLCDLSGACRFVAELYLKDQLSGQYGISPVAVRPVGADGRYAIDAVFGEYKVVMIDSWKELAFTPAAQSGLVLNPDQGIAVADFTAARPRLSGQLTVETSDANFSFCTSPIDCRLVIEVYAYDDLSGSYGITPVAVTSVGVDGRYEIALPLGTYRLKAVDTQGMLEFTPAQFDGVLLDGAQTELSGLNFQAAEPVPSLSVLSIDMSVESNKRGWNAVAVVTVVDPEGNPLPGAEVQGVWSGLVQGDAIALTADRRNKLGEASLQSPRAEASGSITFTVTAITHPLYPYNARLDVKSQDTISN